MTKKILLADDSITIQKVVRITLADGDFNLITVDNGTDAMDKVRTEMPDLVLADVVMPGKDGYQVCDGIKKNPELASIPVVLLAGSFEGFDEIKGAEVGADGYIIKPFESQTLISKVEEMLSRPKPKVRQVEEAPAQTMPKMQAPTQPAEVEPEVKDFMDSLAAEMDHPEKEAQPVAEAEPMAMEEPATAEPNAEIVLNEEPVSEAQPVEAIAEESFMETAQPAEQLYAEPVVEAASVAEAPVATVSEEDIWEAEPVEGEPATGEAVMEAEPVSEEDLWAEPVAEEAAPAGEAVMEAPVAEAALKTSFVQPVSEPIFPEEHAPEAAPTAKVTAEPVSEWEPTSETGTTGRADGSRIGRGLAGGGRSVRRGADRRSAAGDGDRRVAVRGASRVRVWRRAGARG